MIKATATVPGKPPLVILGLSFGNLRKFLAEPRDTYIHVKGSDLPRPRQARRRAGAL